MAAEVVADHAQMRGERGHLPVPHLERAPERVRQHEHGSVRGPFDDVMNGDRPGHDASVPSAAIEHAIDERVGAPQ